MHGYDSSTTITAIDTGWSVSFQTYVKVTNRMTPIAIHKIANTNAKPMTNFRTLDCFDLRWSIFSTIDNRSLSSFIS